MNLSKYIFATINNHEVMSIFPVINWITLQINSTSVYFIFYFLKNKDSLLPLMVQWIAFNIHGTFPLHKMLFIVKKTVL